MLMSEYETERDLLSQLDLASQYEDWCLVFDRREAAFKRLSDYTKALAKNLGFSVKPPTWSKKFDWSYEGHVIPVAFALIRQIKKAMLALLDLGIWGSNQIELASESQAFYYNITLN